jgi:thymidylate synthase
VAYRRSDTADDAPAEHVGGEHPAPRRMIAQQVGMEPGELVWMGGDVHLYLNHAHLIAEQLTRAPQGRPRLEITRTPETIFDYAIEDFVVHDYAPLPPISAPVAV